MCVINNRNLLILASTAYFECYYVLLCDALYSGKIWLKITKHSSALTDPVLLTEHDMHRPRKKLASMKYISERLRGLQPRQFFSQSSRCKSQVLQLKIY
jgi:hypothetical protein